MLRSLGCLSDKRLNYMWVVQIQTGDPTGLAPVVNRTGTSLSVMNMMQEGLLNMIAGEFGYG
jgi:hypothetical protein